MSDRMLGNIGTASESKRVTTHGIINNNIVPDINLITTYETRERPLSMEKIERIITEYFIE